MLKSTYRALTNRSQRGRYLAPRFSQSRLDVAMAAHEALIDAFKKADKDAASEIMNHHVSKTGETVLETLRLGNVGVCQPFGPVVQGWVGALPRASGPTF